MRSAILLLILGCYFVASQDIDNYFGIQDCDSVYPPRGNKTHTYCLPRSPYNLNPSDTKYELSDDDKKAVADVHNKYRASATNPTATDMEFMVWDDELASLAQAWAEQCRLLEHDGNRFSYLYYEGPGQNAFYGNSNWTKGIGAWYNEIRDYTYGQSKGKDDRAVGHYTQVMQHGSCRVGCGYARCDKDYKHYLICNYLGPQWNVAKPYTAGDTCAACPRSCKNNLCNCDGLFCFNGGTKDIDNCTCTCPEAYFGKDCREEVCPGLRCKNAGTVNIKTCECDCYSRLYTGKTCDIKQCPSTELWSSCGTQFTLPHCTSFSNIKHVCPYMCGICTEDERPTCEEDEFCYESAHGCKYLGEQATPEQCATYGAGGSDSSSCHNNVEFGSWTCESCTKYSNVKKDYCPYMCGYCKSECGDLYCKNGGSLKRDKCICECREAFNGTDCSQEKCPGLVCKNGGKILIDSCSCECAGTFSGDDCSIKQCPGVVCENKGKVNTETCECDCYSKLHTGPTCAIKKCPFTEFYSGCGSSWPVDYCTKYSNVPYTCPYMCGICTEEERPTCAEYEFCHESAHGCQYLGVQATPDQCANYGNGGSDYSSCQNNVAFGQWTCDSCTKYSNVKKDYCPYMCGYCKSECGDLYCQNGGTMIRDECRCECTEEFKGTADCGGEKCPGLVCENGGTKLLDSCSCECDEMFSGDDCSTEKCPGLECKNGGKKLVDSCSCECAATFSGDDCSIKECAGVVCENRGKVNTETCECDCYTRLHTGPTCAIKTCPFTELYSGCGTHWTVDYCTKYSNVPYTCPYMCGMCTEEERPTCAEDEFCHESAHGCQHLGVQATPEQCATYGSGGNDSSSCHNNAEFGQWTCESCTKYSNVKKDYCPYMCGYCKSECGDLYCKNGGSMIRDECRCECREAFKGTDCSEEKCPGLECKNGGKTLIDSCSCECAATFSGDDCSIKQCPGVVCENRGKVNTETCECDCYTKLHTGPTCAIKQCPYKELYSGCGTHWPVDYCTKYSNVPYTCPYMCGMCTEEERPTCEEYEFCYESAHGCEYLGVQKTPEQCASLGNAGNDYSSCHNNATFGRWLCEDCTKYSNVKSDYCPYMCGLCKSECGDLYCKNGGTMIRDECRCDCPAAFTGTDCSQDA